MAANDPAARGAVMELGDSHEGPLPEGYTLDNDRGRALRNGEPEPQDSVPYGTSPDDWEMPPPTPPAKPLEADDDPHRLTRLFLRDFDTPDGRTLHYWQSEWYPWKDGACRRLPTDELRAQLSTMIKKEFDRLAEK